MVDNKWDNLKADFEQYKNIFEEVVEIFPHANYVRIKRDEYIGNNEFILYLFTELNFTEIYSDWHGNVFFNRFSEGISFDGIVYLNNPSYVVGIMKTESISIDVEGKWILHYSHGL